MVSIVLRRSIAAICVVGFALVAMALLWSDRAAALLDPFRNVTVEIGRSIEHLFDIDVERDDVPARADQVAHAVLWGSGTLVVGWVARRKVPIAITALFIAGISLLFEFGQPLVSRTRRVEPQDAVGNIVGIAVAALGLAAILAVLRLVRGDDREYLDDRIPS